MSIETAVLTKKTVLSADIIECEFQCDTRLEAKPGQYVLLKVENYWRSFTVAETRRSNTFVIVVQLIDLTVSARFFRNITVGMHLEIQEPRGDLLLPDDKDVTFIATGTGLVPLYTIAKHLLKNGYEHKINIIFGIQTEKKYFMKITYELSKSITQTVTWSLQLASHRKAGMGSVAGSVIT